MSLKLTLILSNFFPKESGFNQLYQARRQSATHPTIIEPIFTYKY
jgi:hypothetical protein